MSILRNYRRIWIKAYGPIPKDSNGRSYEIHHINGNHSDNRLENLMLVTIEEHYAIHKAQGDWYACIAIAKRFNPPDLSEMYAKMAESMKGNQRGKGNKGNKRPDLAERNKLVKYPMSEDGKRRLGAASSLRMKSNNPNSFKWKCSHCGHESTKTAFARTRKDCLQTLERIS